MVRALALALAIAAGCYQPSFPEGLECSETDDCPEGQSCDLGTGRCWPDDSEHCVGDALPFPPRSLDPCTIPAPTGDAAFPDGVTAIDTTAGTITNGGAAVALVSAVVTQLDGGALAMVIVGRDLLVPAGAELVVTGDWPVVLIAFGTLTVDGVIDASANRGRGGAGADRACALGAGTAGVMRDAGMDSGGTGGGGGGLGAAGGRGGDISPIPAPPSSVPGGAPWGDVAGALLGGCRGGGGGVGFAGKEVAAGGGGGGAVELIGGTRIVLTGTVSVSGGGGGGGTLNSESAGGGGGGSGGKIVIQTRALDITGGALTANGGGGGEGRFEIQPAGLPGDDGAMATAAPARGGTGGAGGDGGDGAVTADGSPGLVGVGAAEMPAGGGGGGGGVGRIVIDAGERALTDELVSPPPILL